MNLSTCCAQTHAPPTPYLFPSLFPSYGRHRECVCIHRSGGSWSYSVPRDTVGARKTGGERGKKQIAIITTGAMLTRNK